MTTPAWIGAHVSAAGGIELAPARCAEIDASAMQVFSANQRQWKAKPLSAQQVQQWWEEIDRLGLKKAVTHSSYLINLAATDDTKLERSRQALCEELERSQRLGICGVVLHPGSHLEAGEQEGISAIAESLDAVFEACTDHGGPLIDGREDAAVPILLENTAGQGTNLGYKFNQLGQILRLVNNDSRARLGTCIDTCHTFAAGYDLSTATGWTETWKEWDKEVGFDAIECIHVNDSKRECGSRRDRHAPLGEGQMGEDVFRRLVTDARFSEIPMVLETPGGPQRWEVEIGLLRRWSQEPCPT